MSKATHRFTVANDGQSINYGPSERADVAWALTLSTSGYGKVELGLGQLAMYELWTEIQDVPWPREGTTCSDLQREIVARVQRTDEETLCEVLELLGGDGQ